MKSEEKKSSATRVMMDDSALTHRMGGRGVWSHMAEVVVDRVVNQWKMSAADRIYLQFLCNTANTALLGKSILYRVQLLQNKSEDPPA